MRFQLRTCVVVIVFDRRLFDRAVHPLHQATSPGVVHSGQSLVDVMLAANAAECVLQCISILLAIGEPDAVIRQNRVDLVARSWDQVA